MPAKTVKLLAMFRDLASCDELSVPFEQGCPVSDIIRAVAEACPALGEKILLEDGRLSDGTQLMINGRNMKWLQGLETKIDDDDELIIMPMVGGG